jgi:hypothetical protein
MKIFGMFPVYYSVWLDLYAKYRGIPSAWQKNTVQLGGVNITVRMVKIA